MTSPTGTLFFWHRELNRETRGLCGSLPAEAGKQECGADYRWMVVGV